MAERVGIDCPNMEKKGKVQKHYVAKSYDEVAGKNRGWQNKSSSVRGNR